MILMSAILDIADYKNNNMDLINKDGSINVHDEFTFFDSDKRLKIIGTEDLYKASIWQVIDSVKNLETGKVTELTREKLYKYKPIIT